MDREIKQRNRPWVRRIWLATVALLALAGISDAKALAEVAPKNSVTTSSIRNGAVTTSKLKANAVTGAKLKEDSLDFGVIQRRVSGVCLSGQVVSSIGSDGTVACVPLGGPPTGSAGGSLTGTYPSPAIAPGAISSLEIGAAFKDGLAGVPSLRTLGSGSQQAMPGNATPGGPPTGSAGGDLSGSYPNPQIEAAAITDSEVASANKDGLAGVPSLRTLGSGSQQAMPGDAAPGGPPTGSAGGDLSGSYPNPDIGTGAVTDSEVASANKDGLAGVPSLRTLGSGSQQAMPGDAAPGGPPTGSAGGDLSGSYPNPGIGAGVVTDAEVFSANKDGLASVPSMRTLGSGSQQAMPGNATPGGPPTGTAGGVLSGTYPSPGLNLTGGPCANGKALLGISSAGELSCGTGVFTDDLRNTAVSRDPLPALGQGGGSNSALGEGALQSLSSGSNNTALGQHALLSLASGGMNTAVGDSAMSGRGPGNTNTALGYAAMIGSAGSSAGSFNIGIGALAGMQVQSGSQNIWIGSQGVSSSESNLIRLGTPGTHLKTFIAGISGVTTDGPAVPVLIDGSGQLGVTSSSRRFKEGVEPLRRSAVNRLMSLEPVSFRYRKGSGTRQFGLIAEQVAKVFPNLVSRGSQGKALAVAYQQLPALILAGMKGQQGRIADLESRVERLEDLTRSIGGAD